MGLYPYIVRRLLLTIPILIGITLAAFVISHAIPADPVVASLGQRAQDDPTIVAQFRHQYGFDKPLPQQYLIYVQHLLQGDLGVSVSSRRPVIEDLKQYFPATLELSTAALLISLGLGIPLGVLSAVRRNTLIDHLARLVSLIGISLPVFWLGLLGYVVLWYHLGILPAPSGQLDRTIEAPPVRSGLVVLDALLAGNWAALGNALWHLILPALVLGAYTTGLITRMTRLLNAGGAGAGLHAHRAREGPAAPGHRAAARAAQRGDPHTDPGGTGFRLAALRRGADRDGLRLARPGPLCHPDRRLRRLPRRSWAWRWSPRWST